MHKMIQSKLLRLMTLPLLGFSAEGLAADTAPSPKELAFEQADKAVWQEAFHDPCTGNWREGWFLDGKVATVENTEKGMVLTSGPESGNDAHNIVLWTRDVFAGDIKIEYDFTRLDKSEEGVNIIYIQATGSGNGPFAEDIAKWSELRTTPAMRMYFDHMNTYHISYAVGMPGSEYIRARRYIPDADGLKGTDLPPDYGKTDLFSPGVPHQITIIKRGQTLSMRVQSPEKTAFYHWQNDRHPPITRGRVGLRQMFTKSGRYANFRVSQLADSANPNPASKAQPRDGAWLESHKKRDHRLQGGNADVVLVGDSITHGWSRHQEMLQRLFGDLRVVNLGQPADKTENILWRLKNHSLEKVSPRLAVVLAGTNNSNEEEYTPDQIAGGVEAIIGELRTRWPHTKVLLLGVFPRGSAEQRKEIKTGRTVATMNPQWAKIDEVNRRIASLADGKSVVYLNINRSFLSENGELSVEVMPDLLHLSEKGYEIWGRAMQPVLQAMLSSAELGISVPVSDLAQWPIFGAGTVAATQENLIVLTEGKDSEGVVLLSPEEFPANIVLRFKIRPNQFEGVLMAMLCASPLQGDAISVPEGYKGAMGFWNGPKAEVRNFLFAFHTGYHQPMAFLNRNPGEGGLNRHTDPAAEQRWYEVEVGRRESRVWLKIDGEVALESNEPGNARLPAGRVGFRLRGPGDGSFFATIKDVKLLM
jgi:lysophospholipase L1-like esterase